MQHLLFFSALSWIQLQIFKTSILTDILTTFSVFTTFINSEEIFNSDPRTFLWFHIVQAHPDVRCCTLYMIVWSRISGRIIVFFVWTWVIPAWGTEGGCKPAELYFVISFYSGSGICEECSSGLHILFYVGHSDQSLISSEYRIFGHIFLLSWHSWYEVILMMLGYGTC